MFKIIIASSMKMLAQALQNDNANTSLTDECL